ncbi:UPF0538 protein C2orf76 homolog [Liolophura sinensis]|uniref:UPF0538 protein C2orf76 homolog n=1 Tax=Liolophura sinensis TaxID=3198878 RepID=UPI0031586E76
MVVVTVRLIRSFEHRNIQYLVMKDVDTSQTVEQFKEKIKDVIEKKPGLPPPFRKYLYDTLKISHKAHGAKANVLVIDTEHDDILILKDARTLAECGVENETELSFFKAEDYYQFQKNPNTKW